MSDHSRSDSIPVVLTIAGTDPSGGAGINVDLQVCRDFGCHGVSAITAVVWQNTSGVRGFEALKPAGLVAQLEAVGDDFDLAAVKIGMVPNRELMIAIRGFLEGLGASTSVVLDPVMASGSGTKSMMDGSGRRSLGELRDVVDLVTPNGPEAQSLDEDGKEQADVDPLQRVERLVDGGWKRVLLKGGHLRHRDNATQVVDWYGDESGACILEGFEAVDADVRGTGCQLSTAIACARTDQQSWPEAIDDARRYLHDMLVQKARYIGRGRPVVVRIEDDR